MADNKKYYYLKLKENFFESSEMFALESMPDGVLYSNIYLKLCLKSLKEGGRLSANGQIAFTPEALSKMTGQPVSVVLASIEALRRLGFIEVLDTGIIYLLNVPNFVGESSTEADRVRALRKKADDEKQQVCTNVHHTHCTNVHHISDKCTPEIRDKSLENKDLKEKEKTHCSFSEKPENKPCVPYKEIIGYLNQKAKTNYRSSGAKTQTLIKARFKDGFTLEDFKTVIDNKTTEWLDNADMVKYLRPETLFGTKFESYLNQKTVAKAYNPSGNNTGIVREDETTDEEREKERLYWEQETNWQNYDINEILAKVEEFAHVQEKLGDCYPYLSCGEEKRLKQYREELAELPF